MTDEWPGWRTTWRVLLLAAASIVLWLALGTNGVGGQTADDHGDTFATATNLPLGSSAAGRIDPDDDRDVFRLDLSGRSGSTDVWVYATGELDTVGWLYDSRADLLVVNDDSFVAGRWTSFHLRANLSPDIYYVAVRSYLDITTGQSSTGGYRVHSQAVTDPGSAAGTATPLNLDSPTPGTIDTASDTDYFRMDFSESTDMIIYARNFVLYAEGDDESLDLLPVAPLDVGVLDAGNAEVSVNVYQLFIGIDGNPEPYGFLIRDDFGPGTYYFKVTTPAGVTSHPVPYTIHAFEVIQYTEFIEECEARTHSLNDPQISDPLYACQWHLSSPEGQDINVEAAWAQGVTGEGVNVAVVDDGMYFTHEDLRDNVDTSLNHDYTGGGSIYTPLEHHGTHVAGIITARDNSIGVRGVAPRATVYGYNFLADGTSLNAADAMARNQDVTAVSNNSWGYRSGPGLSYAGSFWERALETGITSGYDGRGGFLHLFRRQRA